MITETQIPHTEPLLSPEQEAVASLTIAAENTLAETKARQASGTLDDETTYYEHLDPDSGDWVREKTIEGVMAGDDKILRAVTRKDTPAVVEYSIVDRSVDAGIEETTRWSTDNPTVAKVETRFADREEGGQTSTDLTPFSVENIQVEAELLGGTSTELQPRTPKQAKGIGRSIMRLLSRRS